MILHCKKQETLTENVSLMMMTDTPSAGAFDLARAWPHFNFLL